MLPTPGSRIRTIAISKADIQAMHGAVEKAMPEEACGLLAGIFSGSHAIVRRTIPVTNILHSPTRFKMSGEEQVTAFNMMELNHLLLVGIFHSHPDGPSRPSQTDILEANYPEAIQLIWSKSGGLWNCRGFSILQGKSLPVKIIA